MFDDDAAFLQALSDPDLLLNILERVYELPPDEAREACTTLFYHYMDPWGHLLDRVIDEGDPKVFSREDRRDLVKLADIGLVAVRHDEVVKITSTGRQKNFTQYHYVLHLDAIRRRLVEAVEKTREEEAPTSVYDDPSLWERRG